MLQHLSLRKIFFVFVLAAAVFFITVQSSATGENSENQQTNTSSEQAIRSLAPPDEPPEIIAAKPPATSDPSPPGPKEPLQISYTPCSKAGGDLIFTFSLPMVKKDKLKTAGYPEVSFEPEQKGTFKWRSPTELVFRPSKGFMNGGHYISISIKKAVPLAGEEYALKDPWRAEFTVPYLKIAGKVANWPIIKGRPRFVSFLNWYTGQIGRGPLFLLYDQPVSAVKVKQLLRLQDNTGKTLEAKVYHPKIGTKQITDSKIDPDYVIAVLFTDLSQESSSVDFEIPDWNTPDQPQKLKHILAVNTSFKLAKISSDSHYYRNDKLVPLKVTWDFVFNNWFETAQLKEVLRMRPEPKSVTVSQAAVSCWSIDWNDENTWCDEREWYSVAHVQLDLDPGTRYRLFTDDWFTDVLGNPLAKPVDITFVSQDLPPILQAPEVPLLLEADVNRFPIQIRNVENLEVNVFRFDSAQDFARAIEAGQKHSAREYGFSGEGEKIRISDSTFKPNIKQTLDLPFDAAPGLLCVEIRASGTGSEASGMLQDAVLVQSTDLGITAKVFENTVFAWVTQLSNAASVNGARVSLYAEGKKVSEGFTDVDGTISLEAKNIASGTGLQKTVFLAVEKYGYMTVSRLVNDELSHPWQFGLNGEVENFGVLHAAVFTDRGVYRPGENVHCKVIIGKESTIQNDEIDLQINDPRGQQVTKETLSLDRFGSADLDVKLKEQAAVGEYLVQISMGEHFAIRKFWVEEYRVPTFQVSVKSEQETWKRDKDISAVIKAKYLHGGSLDGREARWEVLRQPVPFAPPAFPKYVFNLGDPSSLAGSIVSGKKRLDGQGQLVVDFFADHPSSAGPMRYIVEAVVSDVDRQTYSGRLSKVIHPAAFYVGMLPPSRQVMAAGESLQVPIVAVRPNGTAIEGIQVRVRLERIDHHTTARMTEGGTVQMLNRPVPVEQQQCEIVTGKTAVNCAFKLPQAGLYQVRAWAQDSERQAVQAGFQVTASGDTPAAWPRFDQDRIEIVADQSEYKIGDTVRLVVQTPYKKARGLLTVERNGILDYRVFSIEDDTPMLEVPITSEYAPNVFVSVILLRGRIHHQKDASGFETGAPGFKIGYTKLHVDPADLRLAVTVNPARKMDNPGQKMKLNLLVHDQKGQPAPGQATVMVVDEAVLGLTGYQTPDPVAQLYAERRLGVRTGSGRLDLPHARRTRLEKIFPGGDKDKTALLFSDPTVLRKLFMSTAYWNPNVSIGADGTASVEFELPDNLTTYRVMAVVTDENSRAGSADDQLTVRKSLMIQPVLPRFVYPDDELQVEALVFNQTGKTGVIQLVSEFDGLKLSTGSASQAATVKSETSGSFKFPVKIVGKEEAVIRFAAKIGEHTDAVEVKLPILEPGTRRTSVVSKSILDTDTLSVTIPAERIPGSVQMEVVTSTTVLSELKDSVQYLMRYPNGCIEQTTSTAYPLVVLKDLLPEIGIEVDRADLKKFSEAGIRRILSFQTPSGGLSYWPGGSEPHAFATAFGLTALIEAKKKGYDVPDEALAGMADYLEAALRKGNITENIPHGGMADGDTRALFVMTLGRLGRPQSGYISVLWREREKLTAFGLSFLAIAVKELPGDKSLLEPILAEVRKAAEEEEREAYFNGKPKGEWSFDSPLRTHGTSLIAFAEAGKSGEMTSKLLAGLLKRRNGGLWGNTQENVFGIMGVHAVAARKTDGSAPVMELKVHDRDVLESEMEKSSNRVRHLTLKESELTLQDGIEETREVTLKNNGATPIILTVRAQYEVPLNEKNRQALSNGFSITRRYETLEGDLLEGKPIPLGSLIRVRLNVRTDAEHHYVAIDDKLPAGLEPLNTSLETTEKVSGGEFSAAVQRGFSVLSYKEIRDSRVAFYVDEMLPGEYEYIYVARATTPGRFLRPAGRAESMYQPEISGTTSIDEVAVNTTTN